MPTSLLFALICSHAALFLMGMFVALVAPQSYKKKNIKEYRRFYEEEMRNTQKNSWDHPPLY